MSEAANRDLARRWYEEVWNQGRESTIDELFHPQGKAFGFPDPDSILTGPEEFKAVHRQFHSAFSGIHIAIDDLIAERDQVAIRWTGTMTHSGDGLSFPATRKTAALNGSSFITCCDGKITAGWNFMDFTKLTLQLQGHALKPA